MVWEEWGLVVEVDGIHHALAQEVVADALRHNDVTLGNLTVLRLPVLGLRVAADDFFDQIERALVEDGLPGTRPRRLTARRTPGLPSLAARRDPPSPERHTDRQVWVRLRMTLAVERHTAQVWVRLRMTLAAPGGGSRERGQGRKRWATQ